MNSVLAELNREFGVTVKGNFATDVVEGIPVKISFLNNYAKAGVVCSQDYYQKIKSEIPGGFASYQNGQVAFTISNGNPVKTYQQIRESIPVLFADYYAEQTCPYCKGVGCDLAGFYNGQFVKVHRSCYEHAVLDGEEKSAKSGNIVVGTLLAFVVCILGLLINVGDIIFSGEEYPVLYALAPIFAGCAYAWKGRRGIAGSICATVAAFMGFFCSMYFCLASQLAEARSLTITEAAFTRVSTILGYFFPWYFADNIFNTVLLIVGLAVCFFVAKTDLNAKNGIDKDLTRPLIG